MKPTNIKEYLETFSDEQKEKLTELREVIKSALPGADEKLKWGNIAFIDKDGMILIIVSGHKHHMNLVATPSTKEAMEDELDGYETGKGSVKLMYDKTLPINLIEKIVQNRANEYRKHGVKWM